MRILITRPQPEAARFAAQLSQHGIDAVVAPLMTIETLDAPLPPLDHVQALVFTSANGVRAYVMREGRTDLPAFTVGDATAAAAHAAGFRDVVSAGGDWRDLAERIGERLDPAKGRLFHATGEDQAGDLGETLRALEFDLVQTALYRASPVAELPAPARAFLTGGEIDGVALFSPRSATIFSDLVAAAGLTERLAQCDAFCLSAAVAAALGDAERWRAVHVAARPDAETLIALIRDRQRTGTTQREAEEPLHEADARDVGRIIAAFGGPRAMAKALGIAVTTVEGWQERGAIPLRRWEEIRATAARTGIDLDASDQPPAEAVAAERIKAGPQPGLRAAETEKPPPPILDAPAGRASGGRWRWAMLGAGFAATFLAGAIGAAVLGLGRSGTDTQRQALDRLQARISAVTSQLEEQQKRQSAEAAGLQARINRIEALERSVGEQRDRLTSMSGNAAALASRLERLDMDLKALAARTPPAAEDVKTLREQVDALVARLQSLPRETQDATALAAALAQMKQMSERLAALEQRTQELAQARPSESPPWREPLERQLAETKAAFTRLSAEAELLRKDMAAVQARAAATAEALRRGAVGEGTGALLLAIGQLRQAALAGEPYRAALEAAAALAKDRAGMAAPLETLRRNAERGVPTLATLRPRFDRTAVAVLRAAAAPGADAGFWDRLWSRVQSLVTVRRVGEVAGESPAAMLSRAEAALARGDLAGAVREVSSLSGPAREAAQPWLADAQARLGAETALAALDRAALALLRPAELQPRQ